MPKKGGISWRSIYQALRSERLPHEIREELTGMNLQEVKQLREEEYIDLVTKVYWDTTLKGGPHNG